MKARWPRIGVVTGVLFAINVIGRLAVWKFARHNDGRQTLIGLITVAAVAVALGIAGYLSARRRPMGEAVGELALAALFGCALTVAVGPFAGGSAPFVEGGTFFVSEVWHYLLVGAVGIALGVLVAMALGQDHRSQALKRYARTQAARPRRVVRR